MFVRISLLGISAGSRQGACASLLGDSSLALLFQAMVHMYFDFFSIIHALCGVDRHTAQICASAQEPRAESLSSELIHAGICVKTNMRNLKRAFSNQPPAYLHVLWRIRIRKNITAEHAIVSYLYSFRTEGHWLGCQNPYTYSYQPNSALQVSLYTHCAHRRFLELLLRTSPPCVFS